MATQQKRVARWYFGGLSSVIAVTVTHPLDLIKVHLQTQEGGKAGFIRIGATVVKDYGFLSLYNGISASAMRQLLYSFPRFGLYELYKNKVEVHRKMSLIEQITVSGISGMIGGIFGTPPDIVNVRMQNDMRLPPDKRRNYKHVFDGFIQIYRQEGFGRLFSGYQMATTRAIMMTIGQATGYDKLKQYLLSTGYFQDNPIAHFVSATGAACLSIALTNPLDVIKTRLMNSEPGKYSGVGDVVKEVMKGGPLGFYKGLIPAFVRIGPHTIIMFLIKEQFIKFFGHKV